MFAFKVQNNNFLFDFFFPRRAGVEDTEVSARTDTEQNKPSTFAKRRPALTGPVLPFLSQI